MNDFPPPYDENNPEEGIRFYWQQFQAVIQSVMGDHVWKVRSLIALVMTLLLLWVFRALFYPMSANVILKVIAYGIVPAVLALAGDHFAAAVVTDSGKRRMYRAFFIVVAMLGVLLIGVVENKSDREHRTEVDRSNQKIDTVLNQNTAMLNKILSPAPEQDAQTKEVSRRQNILALLRNEYILTHKDVDSALIAGTEQPPANWVNGKLKQLGEIWTIEDNVKPTSPKVEPTPVISPDPYVGVPNATVAMWALREADNVEALSRKADADLTAAIQRENKHIPPDLSKGFVQSTMVQGMFWDNYNSYHQQAITKLHDSITLRLGPVVAASKTKEYKELLDDAARASQDKFHGSWVLMDVVQDYARELRKMAQELNH